MFSLIKYFPVIILLFTSTLLSQTVQQIQITGNKIFDDNSYKEWSGLNIGSQVYTGLLDSAKSRIAKQLSLRGYFNASFSPQV